MPFVRATSKVYLAFIFLCILYYHYYGLQFWITQVEPEMCNREDISLKSIRFHNAKHLDFTTRFTSHLYDTLFTSDDSEIDFHCNTRFKYTDLVNEILMKDESEDLLTSEIDHPSFLSYNFDQYEGSGFIKSKLFEMIKTFIGQRVTIKSEFYQKNSTDGKTERFLSHHIYSNDQYWWRNDPLIVVSKCSEKGCTYGESYHAINSSSLSKEVMHASVEMEKTEGFVSFKNLTIPVVLNSNLKLVMKGQRVLDSKVYSKIGTKLNLTVYDYETYENVDPARADIILSIAEGEIMNYTSLFYFSFIWICIALIPNYPRNFIRSPSFNSFIQILNVKNISDRYKYVRHSKIQFDQKDIQSF
ncbi:unnamed protein product [Moneuplotes crassus]|uniref:Uncharacterized protein n=1 Tax=Euplotes crassus TaxID=5936 RepID=A0AAD2D930_EUPCR|nr:unnamed protein product [Moneuplotes crassus]